MSKAQLIKETNKNKEVGTSINKEAKGTLKKNGIETNKGKVGRPEYSEEYKAMIKANKAQLSIITNKRIKQRVNDFIETTNKQREDKGLRKFTFSEWAENIILKAIEKEGF